MNLIISGTSHEEASNVEAAIYAHHILQTTKGLRELGTFLSEIDSFMDSLGLK